MPRHIRAKIQWIHRLPCNSKTDGEGFKVTYRVFQVRHLKPLRRVALLFFPSPSPDAPHTTFHERIRHRRSRFDLGFHRRLPIHRTAKLLNLLSAEIEEKRALMPHQKKKRNLQTGCSGSLVRDRFPSNPKQRLAYFSPI